MKFIDWFAGIGGFRRGMELAGHECVGFCEFDKFASASYRSMHTITEQQREYLATMDLKHRQKEILKEEYLNGEWYANDIRRVYAGDIPRADCWCFGFPCQDISIAGKQCGFTGNRSSLFFRVMYLLGQLKEEERPTYLFIENVKNLLSVNGGWDFARLLIEMDKAGYDAEWSVLNSKDFGVPQNRERCFIVGHFRGRGGRNVFPVEPCDAEASELQGCQNRNRVVSNTLDTGCQVGQIIVDDRFPGSRGPRFYEEYAPTIKGGASGLQVMQIGQIYGTEKEPNPQAGRVYDEDGISPCISSGGVTRMPMVCRPCITPDRINKRQRGRRFKEDGEEMFTLTAQDKHGVLLDDGRLVRIRRLTPKECFRLQGWTDDYFEKAQFVNSDSQLYKQAGNGVTVNVIEAIARRF